MERGAPAQVARDSHASSCASLDASSSGSSDAASDAHLRCQPKGQLGRQLPPARYATSLHHSPLLPPSCTALLGRCTGATSGTSGDGRLGWGSRWRTAGETGDVREGESGAFVGCAAGVPRPGDGGVEVGDERRESVVLVPDALVVL